MTNLLTPFILGALFAYLGNPFVTFLANYRVPRTLGVLCVFFVVILLTVLSLLLFIPLIHQQLLVLIAKIPLIIDWIYAHTQWQDKFNLPNIRQLLSQHAGKVKDILTVFLPALSDSTAGIFLFFTNVLLVPVVAFYLMRDWPKLMQNIIQLIPIAHREKIVSLAQACDEVVGAFFKGQLCVMLSLSVIYSVGLWLIGLNIAFLVGLLAGLLAIVPYLGATVGILTASIAMYVQVHDWLPVVYVWMVFAVGQSIESMVLTPAFVGDRLGLHPVAVIFSVMAGGVFFGFFGVLVALPVAAIIWVLFRKLACSSS